MALPLIIGAAALAAASYGTKKGYDGYQKHSEANDIVNGSKALYEQGKEAFEDQEGKTQYSLSRLGEVELEIGQSFDTFKSVADSLLEQLNQGRQDRLEIHLPKHELQRIEKYSYTAVGVLGSIAGAGAAGAAAGFAVYGGVMTLGAASTGTAISSLAGAAATKATLAAIGGGSLATGGLGIAGGTAILGAAVAAPVLAIAGWAYDNHGKESLNNARKIREEVNQAVKKFKNAQSQLKKTERYCDKVRRSLSTVYNYFNRYLATLQEIEKLITSLKSMNINPQAELEKQSPEIMQAIESGYALATILTDMILTPLFKVKTENGTVSVDNNGAPIMEVDKDGLMILNQEALDLALENTATRADEYKS